MNAMPNSQPPAGPGAMPAEAGAPQGAPVPEQAMGETVQASPEEQALYDHFVAKAWELVYSEKMFPKVLQMLDGAGDPVEGLAQTAALVIGRVAVAAEKGGQEMPGDVMLNASTEVFEDLANLSTKAKIHDFEKDPDALEGAYFRALDAYRTMLQQSGKLDKGAAAADMEKLVQMDKGGQLEDLFRRLAGEKQGGGPAPEAEAEPPAKPGGLMQEKN